MRIPSHFPEGAVMVFRSRVLLSCLLSISVAGLAWTAEASKAQEEAAPTKEKQEQAELKKERERQREEKRAKEKEKQEQKEKEKSKGKDKEKPKTRLAAETFAGLELRSIGPAMISGRIGDIAIHPSAPSTWYVAVASGNVWKTVNAGTTWTPIFDDQGSYSIGCITIDPKDPLTLWLGTGENNSQRSVAYGDGVYRSQDGGKSWENVGLKSSEHIAKILVDPRDSRVVWVAAQGPLWAPGGERGLYRTEDGGKTWTKAFETDENTGVTDVVFDPRDPDVMLAATYQRRRHVWTLINGGPGSGIWKSTDSGKSWRKLASGLPKEDMGRIGLAAAPTEPGLFYAVIEAANKAGGFFRSTDAGGSWEKVGDYVSPSAQYYHELFVDPKDATRIYAMDTWMQVSEDGGKTFRKVGETWKHVDNHVLWIDPEDTKHMIAGCDGGVYQTWDRGATWQWSANLPLAQFYKVGLDDAKPFYNVYGGTQDNNTVGGPSRNTVEHGIRNEDWFTTLGGDGFQTQVDPNDPNIVYSQAQYGVLVRFDRRTGEAIDIQPQPEPGEPALRWNWDSPLLLSPHSPTRLYFASQRLFRSDDRGESWTAVSPDLTRQIDRNKLPVMGRVWSVDAVAKNASTSFYGNIVALAESTAKEGLILVGTDDGLIQITEDGGKSWRKIERVQGVPDRSYVSRLVPSQHDAGVVYATFDNHKMGDFKPYVFRSADLGRTWTSVTGDLPERGTVYALVEDHVDSKLLFAGTEFGVFFTPDGGKTWIELTGGMPTIQVRDLAIQKRENDLVAATFGRGFYILDDYTPLRSTTAESLEAPFASFGVKPAWMFIPSTPLSIPGKAYLGDSYFTAPNPPFGAVFTYYLSEEIKTRRKTRLEQEKEKAKKGEDTAYPEWSELKKEDREEDPKIVLTVTDEDGQVVRRIDGPVGKGFHRVAWDLRYPAPNPTSLVKRETTPWDAPLQGPLVAPGRYKVSFARVVDGSTTAVGEARSFEAAPLGNATLPPKDREALLAFQRKTARLQRAVLGAVRSLDEADARVAHLEKAIADTPQAAGGLESDLRAIETRLKDLRSELTGDPTIAGRNEPVPPSIADRVQQIVGGHWGTTSDATQGHRRNYDIAAAAFAPVLEKLRTLVTVDLVKLEGAAEAAGAPWTPGRVPTWTKE
jgi:photosystem II stability/assembly factor-like uncharacterized protein